MCIDDAEQSNPLYDLAAMRDHGTVVDTIIEMTRANIGALAAARDCVLTVSAGRDSRLLFAMAGQHRQRIKQFFIHVTNGLVTAAPNEMVWGTQAMIGPGAPLLRGHQTDLLRAVHVSWSDRAKWKDFMFLEIFYSASLGSGFPANWHCFYLSPFNARRLISPALGFGDAYRLSGRLVDDILFRIDPELAALPFGLEYQTDAEEHPKAVTRLDEARDRHKGLFPQSAPRRKAADLGGTNRARRLDGASIFRYRPAGVCCQITD